MWKKGPQPFSTTPNWSRVTLQAPHIHHRIQTLKELEETVIVTLFPLFPSFTEIQVTYNTA